VRADSVSRATWQPLLWQVGSEHICVNLPATSVRLYMTNVARLMCPLALCRTVAGLSGTQCYPAPCELFLCTFSSQAATGREHSLQRSN
jgi:hypothetical protein